ncbi:MAG: hypothetical protein JXA95_05205, partial [Spirochaetales bacterium]|nr:hypothetical protein [Spirochaetales bacterium]
RFSRKEDSLILRYKWKGKRHVLPFGLFEPVESSLAMGGGKYPCYGYVTVLDDGVLRFTLKITGDSLGGINILAARKGDNLSLRIGTYRERELKMLDGCYGAVRR